MINPIPSTFAFENTSLCGVSASQFIWPVPELTISHSATASGSEQLGAAGPPPTATAADLIVAVVEPTKVPNDRSRGGLCEPPSSPLRILTAVIWRLGC